jgi:hypothetical protein
MALLRGLQPTDLASAEPRDDWGPRLDALRGLILWGQGQNAQAVALLAPAAKTMEDRRTPSADLEPFRKALASARQDATTPTTHGTRTSVTQRE